MEIFLIDSLENGENENSYNLFRKIVKKQLEKYGVPFIVITEHNIEQSKNRLDKQSMIIIYNKKEGEIQPDFISGFLEKAIKKGAKIWPVAFNREKRKPEEDISNMQSYDVWEQLRCRSLNEAYMPAVAMAFSRQIISCVYPTLYNERGELFVSHRRLDGEGITALLCDRIQIQAKHMHPFRDVAEVKVGEEAQKVIDKVMANSEIFIFIYTEESAKSDWILKELRFALLRNIPVLWVQIDDADPKKLKIDPSENPHLKYKSEDFKDENLLIEIVDEILQKSFELIMTNSKQIFSYVEAIENLFDEKMQKLEQMIYCISIPRKGYRYKQRNIEQYFQIFGRTSVEDDEKKLKEKYKDIEKDSVIILSNKVVNLCEKEGITIDSIEDFYYYWSTYINGKKGKNKMEKEEIVISGAFPDCDEIYKQSLTDAVIIFAKAIMRSGYTLTFGAHPTFQELFFEMAKKVHDKESRNVLKMFISDYFMKDEQEAYYNNNCQLIRTEKREEIPDSLSIMRKEMIQRKEVKALVCLGGKIKTNKDEEGVREEVKLAIEYNIPVFIVGSVGGCSADVAMEYKNNNWKDLNNAPKELNEEFLNSINYFKMVQDMLKFID